jgi:hypothetical protein
MLFQFDKLVHTFQHLLMVQKEIMTKREFLTVKLNALKDTYSQLVKSNSKKIFLFCLDSFYFQYKILTIELDNINRFSALINNRMYGDYYKLYNIMLTQMQEPHRTQLGTPSSSYPVYKELEPFFEYKMSDIIHLHRDILRVLHFLHLKFNEKQVHIQTYSDEINVGRSITSFLHTHEYENTLLREQMTLYVNYLEFFHTTQTNYMTKLFLHIDRFQREIEEEILTNYASIKPPDVSSDHPASELETAAASLVDPPPLSEIEESFCAADLPPQKTEQEQLPQKTEEQEQPPQKTEEEQPPQKTEEQEQPPQKTEEEQPPQKTEEEQPPQKTEEEQPPQKTEEEPPKTDPVVEESRRL